MDLFLAIHSTFDILKSEKFPRGLIAYRNFNLRIDCKKEVHASSQPRTLDIL